MTKLALNIIIAVRDESLRPVRLGLDAQANKSPTLPAQSEPND